jgi:hypothetical protein
MESVLRQWAQTAQRQLALMPLLLKKSWVSFQEYGMTHVTFAWEMLLQRPATVIFQQERNEDDMKRAHYLPPKKWRGCESNILMYALTLYKLCMLD